MDYPIHFADQLSQHLKAFRKVRKLTQSQLAIRLGVSQSRIADIETNPGKVSLENILKVLAALDIRVLLKDIAANSVSSPSDNNPKTLAELKAIQVCSNQNGTDW